MISIASDRAEIRMNMQLLFRRDAGGALGLNQRQITVFHPANSIGRAVRARRRSGGMAYSHEGVVRPHENFP